MEVHCPVCDGTFTIDAPEEAAPAAESSRQRGLVKLLTVDLRMLVPRSLPAYFKMLLEVPRTWDVPANGEIPATMLEAVNHASRTKFPNRPVTALKVHAADPGVLHRSRDEPDYSDESCRVWLLGKTASAF